MKVLLNLFSGITMIKITDNKRGYIFVYHSIINLRIKNFELFSWMVYREFKNNGDYHMPCVTKNNVVVIFNFYL